MAKSVTQAMSGIAVRRGLDIENRWGIRAGRERSARGDRGRSWINMTDGQDYKEVASSDQTQNDAARMLFGAGRLDVAGFAASLPPRARAWHALELQLGGVNSDSRTASRQRLRPRRRAKRARARMAR